MTKLYQKNALVQKKKNYWLKNFSLFTIMVNTLYAGPTVGGHINPAVFYVQKERILKLALIRKMWSMWSNNGGQESDFLTYSRVLEPYHMDDSGNQNGSDERNHLRRNGLLYERIKR